jgi:glycosyltransferase involved in cell wall biosynthesis
MGRPLVSIITVCLNAGQDLIETALSVEAQRFDNFEHIIKDGGSSDGSLDLVEQFSHAHVVSCSDDGIYAAMNQALPVARGRFVLFLNAGDRFAAPTALGEIAPVLQRQNAPELVYCDYINATLGLTIRSPAVLTEFFLYRTMLCHQACFFRADSFRRIGMYNTSFRVVADYEFLVRLVLKHRGSNEHVAATCTSYKGSGFSLLPANRLRLAAEVKMVRREHFSPSKRLAYGLARLVTLPGLRGAIAAQSGWPALGRAYWRTSNLANAILCRLHGRKLRGGLAGRGRP